jgi:hypothetical protein
VDPVLTGPAWTAEGDHAGSQFGFSVASAGDVNRDGYSDVIVGAWLYDNGQLDEGRGFLYMGSALGLTMSPAWNDEGDIIDKTAARSVSTGGEVNRRRLKRRHYWM